MQFNHLRRRKLAWVFNPCCTGWKPVPRFAITALSLLVIPLLLGAAPPKKPNVVLIFTDDQGYGDVGCYGSKVPTPNLDRMASQGMRFTDFYVAQAVCSASRAALLTGCYSNRVGILGALGPRSPFGINQDELTVAELFKENGYATAIYGKWHLGDAPRFLPTRHGFDEFFGLPYSNDMWPNHPTHKGWPDLPLMENEKVLEVNPDQTKLTTWYTEHAVSFIERNIDRPFFLYVPHSLPHVPLHVSEKYESKTGQGLYADVIAEVDWSVGEILKTIDRVNLSDNTLVIFTCDNGPWLSYGNHGGSAGPLREGKTTAFEGGVREPCIMRWPGTIPAGTVCRQVASTIDLLPTFAGLLGAKLPGARIIDGKDISDLMRGDSMAQSPHEAFYYYWGRELQAIRSGKWKLHFPHKYSHVDRPGSEGLPGKIVQVPIELSLFDMEKDPGETTNVAEQHPDVVEKLKKLAEKARDDLGDSLTNTKGANVRAPGQIATQPAATTRAAQ
jgi:arylsulfatase A